VIDQAQGIMCLGIVVIQLNGLFRHLINVIPVGIPESKNTVLEIGEGYSRTGGCEVGVLLDRGFKLLARRFRIILASFVNVPLAV
jgi:hypothetical protein